MENIQELLDHLGFLVIIINGVEVYRKNTSEVGESHEQPFAG